MANSGDDGRQIQVGQNKLICFSAQNSYFSQMFGCAEQVFFETSLPDEFKVTQTPFAVPARLSRLGLSEIINHLLELPKVN